MQNEDELYKRNQNIKIDKNTKLNNIDYNSFKENIVSKKEQLLELKKENTNLEVKSIDKLKEKRYQETLAKIVKKEKLDREKKILEKKQEIEIKNQPSISDIIKRNKQRILDAQKRTINN